MIEFLWGDLERFRAGEGGQQLGMDQGEAEHLQANPRGGAPDGVRAWGWGAQLTWAWTGAWTEFQDTFTVEKVT